MKVTINLDEDEVKILKKRAKKNLFDIREMVEDIVRRSCISKGRLSERKTDDTFVNIFSREFRGRKKKR